MELRNECGQGNQPHEQLRNGRASLTFSVNAPLGGGGLSLGARSWRASEKRHKLVLLMVVPVNVDAKVIRIVDCGPGKEKNGKRKIIDDAVVRVRDERIPRTIFITYIRS